METDDYMAAGQVKIHASTGGFGGDLKAEEDQFPTGKLWKEICWNLLNSLLLYKLGKLSIK